MDSVNEAEVRPHLLTDSPTSSTSSSLDDRSTTIGQPSTSLKSRFEHFSYSPQAQSKMPTTRPVRLSTHVNKPKPAAKPSGRIIKKSSDRATRSQKQAELSKSSNTTKPVKKRSTAKQRSANDPYYPENKLVDSIREGLLLLMVGVNPGLMTALTGEAYSYPSNRYWPLMFTSGVTPKKHEPRDTHSLVDLYNIGHTNIVERPSRDASSLTSKEYAEGARILEEKVRKYKPEAVALVGKKIWEVIWKYKTGKPMKQADFRYGWQDEEMQLGRLKDHNGKVLWPGAKTCVVCTTSGLATQLNKEQRLETWKPLGQWVQARRNVVKEELMDESALVKAEDT